jgi:hypothetical protein
MAPIPNLRRQRLCAALTVACLGLYALPANSQGLEFQGLELGARLDNPTGDNLWRLGDANGNGEIDNDETGGQYFDFDHTLNETPQPNRTKTVTRPTVVYIPILFGYRDYVGDPRLLAQPQTIAYYAPEIRWLTESYTSPNIVESFSFARSSGMQLSYGMTFAADHGPPSGENEATVKSDRIEIGAGARFFSLIDRSVLDYAWYVDSTLDAQSIGPQLSIDWTRQRGRFEARAGAAASMAYTQTEGIQSVVFLNSLLLPGGLNQSMVLTSQTYSNSLEHDDFLPMAEAGIQASYRLTPSVVCFARCDALYFGNLPQARDAVVWRLPDMGLTLDNGRDVFTTFGTLGLEWRR